MSSKTLFEKLWNQHVICALSAHEDLLRIDRIFLHERTGGIALVSLAQGGRKVRAAQNIFCSMDHIVDTNVGRTDATKMPSGTKFIQITREAAQRAGIKVFDINDENQGIVHVISPEQGIVLPGLTIICPDSHTCTQGAFGALAIGVGSTQAEHAMATNSLRLSRPKSMRVNFDGHMTKGVSAKDIILQLIGKIGVSGGRGYAVEFCGSVVRDMDMEARMTLCNMAVEFGAFTGVIAPDDATFTYLNNRPYAPRGEIWKQAVIAWRELKSDGLAVFDREVSINTAKITPTVSWGTSPQQVAPISGKIPKPKNSADEKSLKYMGLRPNTKLTSISINSAFIGSCTNARISDLRRAAAVLRGRRVSPKVKAICVPGSTVIKKQAEEEGLDKIFIRSGFSWRESGCSMCFYAGGESFGHQDRVVSSTNRNFENRQGPKTRTHIASPETVAASAIAGHICSPSMLKGINA